MKKEDLLVFLFAINFLNILYYIPTIMETIYEMWTDGNLTINFFYILNISSHYFFFVIGVIGANIHFQNRNIYNRYFKIFFIFFVSYFFFNLPNFVFFILELIDNLKYNLYEINWQQLFFQVLSFLTVLVAAMVFSQEEIRVKEKPVKKPSIRFKHLIIDGIYLAIFSFQLTSHHYYIQEVLESSKAYSILILLLPYFYYLFYYWISESIFQQTIGKVVTKKYVRKSDGDRASIGRIFKRTLCRFIPFEPFSYLVTPIDGWHDNFSKTDVYTQADGLEDGILEHLISEDDQ